MTFERDETHAEAAAGRVMLITGASSGIGEITARRAVEAGYRLVLGARRIDRLQQLCDDLGGPEVAICMKCDVNDWDDQQALVETGLLDFGHIDAVFANAGFGAPRGFLESTPDHWRDMVLTNVYGCALTIRATLPALTESRGHMILTSSVAGRRALPGSLYSATKFAVSAMGEALRQEVDGTGMRVTLIEPGMVNTPFFDDGTPDWALQGKDIAECVLFALDQPPHVDINEILVRPTGQAL